MEHCAIIADVNSIAERKELLSKDLYIPKSVLDFLNRHQNMEICKEILQKIDLKKVIQLPKIPNAFADFDKYEAYFILSVMKFKVKNNVRVATKNSKIQKFCKEHGVQLI